MVAFTHSYSLFTFCRCDVHVPAGSGHVQPLRPGDRHPRPPRHLRRPGRHERPDHPDQLTELTKQACLEQIDPCQPPIN